MCSSDLDPSVLTIEVNDKVGWSWKGPLFAPQAHYSVMQTDNEYSDPSPDGFTSGESTRHGTCASVFKYINFYLPYDYLRWFTSWLFSTSLLF